MCLGADLNGQPKEVSFFFSPPSVSISPRHCTEDQQLELQLLPALCPLSARSPPALRPLSARSLRSLLCASKSLQRATSEDHLLGVTL